MTAVSVFPRGFGLLAVLLALVATARADPQNADEFYAAVRQARGVGAAEAIVKFQAFAEAHPKDSLAADAWLEIARLREEKLGDFAGALAAYRHVVEAYPDSKSARRARFRIDKLEADRQGGDEPLRRYREILADFAKAGSQASVARMRALVGDDRGFAKRDEALLWIADQEFRARRLDEASEAYRRVLAEYPRSKVAFRATRGLGDLSVERRDFAEARRWYAALATYGDVYPFAGQTSSASLREVHEFEVLRRIFRASLAILAAGLVYLVAATRWREARALLTWRSFVAIPAYVALAAVPAVLLAFRGAAYGKTAAGLIGGTATLLFLGRTFLAGRAPSAAAKLTHGFVMALLICAVIYSVFYAGDLVNITWDTIRANAGEFGR